VGMALVAMETTYHSILGYDVAWYNWLAHNRRPVHQLVTS
jgi:hypothetical protein